MTLSVTHSPQSICTSLLAAEITLINQYALHSFPTDISEDFCDDFIDS